MTSAYKMSAVFIVNLCTIIYRRLSIFVYLCRSASSDLLNSITSIRGLIPPRERNGVLILDPIPETSSYGIDNLKAAPQGFCLSCPSVGILVHQPQPQKPDIRRCRSSACLLQPAPGRIPLDYQNKTINVQSWPLQFSHDTSTMSHLCCRLPRDNLPSMEPRAHTYWLQCM